MEYSNHETDKAIQHNTNATHPRQSFSKRKISCLRWDSNTRHSTFKADAIPTELHVGRVNSRHCLDIDLRGCLVRAARESSLEKVLVGETILLISRQRTWDWNSSHRIKSEASIVTHTVVSSIVLFTQEKGFWQDATDTVWYSTTFWGLSEGVREELWDNLQWKDTIAYLWITMWGRERSTYTVYHLPSLTFVQGYKWGSILGYL